MDWEWVFVKRELSVASVCVCVSASWESNSRVCRGWHGVMLKRWLTGYSTTEWGGNCSKWRLFPKLHLPQTIHHIFLLVLTRSMSSSPRPTCPSKAVIGKVSCTRYKLFPFQLFLCSQRSDGHNAAWWLRLKQKMNHFLLLLNLVISRYLSFNLVFISF